MQTIRLTYPHTYEKNELQETVAAIGFFDGIHQGHQAVITKAVKEAKAHGKESAVITFHPHPSVVLKSPEKQIKYLTPLEEKEALLKKLNVDRLYIINFNKELSTLSPELFLQHFIIDLHITHLIAGYDFTFGHKGAGNMGNIDSYLQDACSTTVIKKVAMEGEKVSSTSIRNLLMDGKVDEVQKQLGRHYIAKGKVIEGDKRGRKLGFPTANLQISDDKLLPKQGVYAVEVIYQNELYIGMANLGVKPTFVKDELKPTVEVFIFDFDQSIYGEELTVIWHEYIRAEQKFNGVEEIIAQLTKDEETVRDYFR